jgi:hypothetical protein
LTATLAARNQEFVSLCQFCSAALAASAAAIGALFDPDLSLTGVGLEKTSQRPRENVERFGARKISYFVHLPRRFIGSSGVPARLCSGAYN